MYPLTCVSGYWIVKNKHNNKYLDWFNKTLKINCPYIFFGDSESLEIIKKYRQCIDAPTHYIQLNLKDFVTWKYLNNFKTHPIHSPSKELNCIWNEKIFLIKRAFELNPFNSEYFCWMDAGLCVLRQKEPQQSVFPDEIKLTKYLKPSKFNYTGSNPYIKGYINPNNYYHCISGCYIVHKDIINEFCDIYLKYMDKYVKGEGETRYNNIFTDQVILSLIFNDKSYLFNKCGNGYGEIYNLLC